MKSKTLLQSILHSSQQRLSLASRPVFLTQNRVFSAAASIPTPPPQAFNPIQGHVKLEYAFETARVRLYLPSGGETWFFLDKRTTVADFLKQCQSEDPFLKETSLLTAAKHPHPSDALLYTLLTSEEPLYIQINDSFHQFPLARESVTSSQVKNDSTINDEWYKKCTQQHGISPTHATTLSAFINQFQRQMEGKSQDGLVKALGKSLEFFDDVVVREQIYRLNLRRVQLKEEISKFNRIKQDLDARSASRNRLFFTAASLFFATQFGVSYYCIYEVDWLGWDLVEPTTYTLCQGMFVGGLIYTLRNLGKTSTNFSSMDSHHKNKRLEKWFIKHGVEPERLRYLEEELARVEREIEVTEFQRYA